MSRPNPMALALFLVCLGIPTLVFGKDSVVAPIPQPETVRLENFWADQKYEELQAISKQRLADNPNDPVGLMLKINLAIAADILPTEADPAIATLRGVMAPEQGWIKVIFRSYISAILEITREAPELQTTRRTQRLNPEIIRGSLTLTDMLLARQVCQERVERLNLIDLEALWMKRQDEKLKEWANGQDGDELAAQVLNFQLSIMEAEDLARLEEKFRSLLPGLEELHATFTSISDADLLYGFARYSAFILTAMREPDVTVAGMAEAYDNMRDLTPPAILLANRLVRGC